MHCRFLDQTFKIRKFQKNTVKNGGLKTANVGFPAAKIHKEGSPRVFNK